MMVVIGFGSIFSWTECVLDSSVEILNKWKQTRHFVNSAKRELVVRFCICALFFIVGLFTLTTKVR